MSNNIVDVHSHPLLPEYLKLLTGGSDTGSLDGIPTPEWSVAKHLEMMDAHGIQRCILSLPEAALKLTGSEGHKLARQLNDELAEMVSQHPDRFGAFAVVPLDKSDASLAETEYALDQLHFQGVSSPTQFRGKFLGEPEYDAWFEELDHRGTPLFVHPAVPNGFDMENPLNVSVVDFMFESTKMITTMVLSGAKKRFANIPFISTHAGGAIPMLAHRVSLAGTMPWAFRGGPKMSTEDILASIRTFHFDLTASTSEESLGLLQKLVPAQQIYMGFDFPLMPQQTIAPAIATFEAYKGFDSAAKNDILRNNAKRLSL